MSDLGNAVATSPTNSSPSSSDLDTESTGSFFPDRSTTLGTLMGVTVQAITFRATSQRRPPENPVSGGRKNKKVRASRARRPWWRLCREEEESEARRASLGQYLEVERSNAAAAELEEGVLRDVPTNLFADGRVLPPATAEESSPAAAAGICNCRFAAGICRFGSVVL